MINVHGVDYLDFSETYRLLNKTGDALRLMLYKGKIESLKVGGRRYFKASYVQNYYANLKNLTPLETSPELAAGEKFFSINEAASQLNMCLVYLRRKIKAGQIKAFCNVTGDILLPQSSIDQYFESKIKNAAYSI